MIISTRTVDGEGVSAVEGLLPRLADLPEDAIVRPHTDPHAAAVTARLVADWLSQPALAGRLAHVGLSADAPRELAQAARAIVAIVEVLGGDYLSDAIAVPTEIEARGQMVRASTIEALESALPWDRDVNMWLEAVRMGSGLVDLVYDLRTLAELLTRHATAMPDSLERLPSMLRTTSDAIEFALRSGEPPEHALARGRLARIWTIFVPAYERAATAARVLSRDQGAERTFPPLALVASHRRARRRAISRPPPSARGQESASALPSVRASAAEAPAAARDPKKDSAKHPTASGSRKAYRAVLELEVGVESDSNFYVGFTENVSNAGVFVATYAIQPIGSRLEIALTLPGVDSMRINGTVRWQRDASEEGWPGMGVQFEQLSKEQEALIKRFLSLREPLFYED
jgi:uncharacterized protein (TIGR02266 family)